MFNRFRRETLLPVLHHPELLSALTPGATVGCCLGLLGSWLHRTLPAFVLNPHCLGLSTRTQHSRWNKSAIRSPVEDRLTGSGQGNVCGTQQGMEEMVQKQICPCKYLKSGPMCPNLRSKYMCCRATHIKCCPAYLNRFPASTTATKNPILWGKEVAREKCRGTSGWFLRKAVPRHGGGGGHQCTPKLWTVIHGNCVYR